MSDLGEITVYSLPSAPRTIGGVLDDAINLFRESLPRSWPLALLAQSGAIFGNVGIPPGIGDGAVADPQAALHALLTGGFLLSAAVGMLLGLIANCALIDHVNGIATGKPAPLAESLGRSLGVGIRRLPHAFLVTLLVALIVLLGLVLLVVPGIYWAGALALALVAVVVDRAGVFDAMSISRNLIKGHWWRSMTIYSVAVIIGVVAYFVLGLIIGVFVRIAGTGGSIAAYAPRLIMIAGGALMVAWFQATTLSIYYDLKLRHEGGDLARRVDSLPAR